MPPTPHAPRAAGGRLDGWARRVAKRRSLQSLDRYARLASAVIPRLNRARQLRVLAVTGNANGVAQWWRAAVRGDVDEFRVAVLDDAPGWTERISRRDAGDLAWLTLHLHRSADDLRLALSLAQWASTTRTRERLVALEAALLLEEVELARSLVRTDGGTDLDQRALVDLAHPALGGSVEQWNAAWAQWWGTPAGAPRVAHASGTVSLDALEVAPGAATAADAADAPTVSVVVSSYRPGAELLSAVRSVLCSTWTDLEVLVVDDCSGGEFSGIYSQVAALDERVRVHHMPTNGGTYAIRNWAVDNATGTYLTFHDSDDWMHPHRLERQVRHLLANASAACTTLSARVTADVRLVNSRSLGLKVCEPSLMFHRERIRDHVGYFDSTRKAADAEYRLRIERSGLGPVPVLGHTPLTLQVIASDSLSDSDIRRYWVHLERRIHRGAYERWHQRTVRSGEPLHLDRQVQAGARPFYAPPLISGDDPAQVDVVVELDLLDARLPARALASILDRAASAGLCIGLRHREAWHGRHTTVNPATQVVDLLNGAVVTYSPVGAAAQAPVVTVQRPWRAGLRGLRAELEALTASPAPSAGADS